MNYQFCIITIFIFLVAGCATTDKREDSGDVEPENSYSLLIADNKIYISDDEYDSVSGALVVIPLNDGRYYGWAIVNEKEIYFIKANRDAKSRYLTKEQYESVQFFDTSSHEKYIESKIEFPTVARLYIVNVYGNMPLVSGAGGLSYDAIPIFTKYFEEKGIVFTDTENYEYDGVYFWVKTTAKDADKIRLILKTIVEISSKVLQMTKEDIRDMEERIAKRLAERDAEQLGRRGDLTTGSHTTLILPISIVPKR